jgi:tripartite-type tricarboxylate transporter receptor subunit TctC
MTREFFREDTMKVLHRTFLHLAAAALPAVSRVARAQEYPTRPITMIVPFAPGGASDVTARIIANHMRTVLGQSVIVENVAGAAGNIGTGRVARSAPDGYTLSFGHGARTSLMERFIRFNTMCYGISNPLP